MPLPVCLDYQKCWHLPIYLRMHIPKEVNIPKEENIPKDKPQRLIMATGVYRLKVLVYEALRY
jgi:hypothetical protein